MSNAAALAKLQEAEKELAQLEVVYAELSTDLTLTAASMTPPPAGTVADVVSIGRSLWKGDWGGALMDAVGIIPIVGDGIKGVTKGTKIASSMKDVKRALQAARTKINSKKRALTTDLNQVRKNTEEACKNKTIQACPNMGGGKGKDNGIISEKNRRPLLPQEGSVGTYGELIKKGKKGDNLTPHHMPADSLMKSNGVKQKDGISMNMEQPTPGTGGRHRRTRTYGRKTDLSEIPREALVRDIKDARKIYREDGIYTPEIRRSLQEVIQKNKELYPNLFKK
jgi:hypothetical protein